MAGGTTGPLATVAGRCGRPAERDPVGEPVAGRASSGRGAPPPGASPPAACRMCAWGEGEPVASANRPASQPPHLVKEKLDVVVAERLRRADDLVQVRVRELQARVGRGGMAAIGQKRGCSTGPSRPASRRLQQAPTRSRTARGRAQAPVSGPDAGSPGGGEPHGAVLGRPPVLARHASWRTLRGRPRSPNSKTGSSPPPTHLLHHVHIVVVDGAHGRREQVLERDDVGVAGEVTQDLDLPQRALGVQGVAEHITHLLDGHPLIGAQVAGGADDAVGAPPDGLHGRIGAGTLEQYSRNLAREGWAGCGNTPGIVGCPAGPGITCATGRHAGPRRTLNWW